MSYILEAIKQAESQRGKRKLHNIESNSKAGTTQADPWGKWLTIAIFLNIIIMIICMLWLLSNKSSDNQNYSNVNDDNALIILNESIESSEINSIQVDIIKNDTREFIQLNDKPEYALEEELSLDDTNTIVTDEDKFIEESKFVNTSINDKTIVSIQSKDNLQESDLPIQRLQVSAVKLEPLPQSLDESQYDVQDRKINENYIESKVPLEKINVVRNRNIPELAELPSSFQERIPKIRINAHIYNSDANLRKAHINGRLYHEGDLLNDEIYLEEITPTSIIFDTAGTLFRIQLH